MPEDEDTIEALITRHLRVGWLGLALFVVLGTVLELLHAIKSPVFVDAGRETTRLLLRLAHAHGTLIAIVNVVYALTVRQRPRAGSGAASGALLAALVLVPGGFFLGAFWARGGDPGLGVLLVPAGAAALVIGAVTVVRRVG